MDFGKVPDSELDKIDFTLPDDHTDTEKILSDLKKKFTEAKKKKQKVYVGCAKWGRKEWIGKIYPPKTKEKDFVFHYVKQFNSIELNARHYRLPEPSSIEKWKQDAAKDFKFCPKFPQWISHIRRLKDCQAETDRFINVISDFGENLGTSFLQMPPNFTPKNLPDLEKYLNSLPKDFKVCVEFRHPDWFKDVPAVSDAFAMFNQLKIGMVITDAAGRRDCVHMRLTNPSAFIRFVGNSLHKTDFTRVDDWVKRIKKWLGSGLETIYFMMHMHDEKDSPELVTFAIKKLNSECGLDLKVPVFYDNGEMFAKVL
jgi:uncharacterized protein YecE (DUF72 family)